MQPVTDNADQKAVRDSRLTALREQREALGTPVERDAAADRLHGTGKSWREVAVELGYANGAIARRAALRHRSRQTSVA